MFKGFGYRKIMTKISIFPYWLAEPPRKSLATTSANLWWFKPAIEASDHIVLLSRDSRHSGMFSLPDNTLITVMYVDTDLLVIEEICRQVRDFLCADNAEITFWLVIEPTITMRIVGQIDNSVKTIACVGDLHHMSNAITHARSVLKQFAFDYVLLTHDQYSLFFEYRDRYLSGSNLLQFPVSSGVLQDDCNPLFKSEHINKLRHITLIGSNLATPTHPLRQLVALVAQKSGCIDIVSKRLAFNEWLHAVENSGSILTCSLNGSYSLQTLAPLAYNRVLITDDISSRNHIGQNLIHKHNCLVYKNIRDLRRIIFEIQSRIGLNALERLADNGGNLFRQLQEREAGIKSAIKRPANRTLSSEAFLGDYRVPDIFVDIVESFQEFHRLSLGIVVIISTGFPLHNELIPILDGLLPRLKVLCLNEESFLAYAASFGHALGKDDHFYVHLKPIELPNQFGFLKNSHLVTLKGKTSRQSSEGSASDFLRAQIGLPVWRQAEEYYSFTYLSPV
jgi:hypothetical protein